MSPNTESCTWSLDVFLECYNAIKLGSPLSSTPLAQIKQDLQNVLVVPGRNESSRKTLSAGESGKPVVLPSGLEVILNAPFISSTSTLALELELDELCTAELMQQAMETSFLKGSDPVEAGTLLYFQRYQYILNILGYFVSEGKLATVLGSGSEKTVLTQILASFKKIYSLLSMQNGLIDKQKATSDINDLQFINKITYTKRQLFDLHDLMSQVLYSLIDSYPESFANYETYTTISKHVDETIKSDEDVFLLHYIPALVRIATRLDSFSEELVGKFHASFTAELKSDYTKVSSEDGLDLSKSGTRSYSRVVQIMFFIAFIPWCKQTASRTSKYDFEMDILKQIEWLISYGTLEQILCYSAECMRPETRTLLENGKLLEFRLLLQRHYPSMAPVQLLPQGANEIVQTAKLQSPKPYMLRLFEIPSYRPSPEVCDLIMAPQFHSFFSNFINHAAIVLTQLRDSEEDFLLSSINKKEIESVSGASKGELLKYAEDFNRSYNTSNSHKRKSDSAVNAKDIDLNELATCAELERFYVACVYTYSYRPELCLQFWELDDQNIMGLITWGLANNTSPLITSTFCLLLGSLTYGYKNSSVKVWDLLVHSQDGSYKKNDYSKISVDSILHSLNYYVEALTESLESELASHARKLQEQQEHMYSGEASASNNRESSTIQLSEDSVAFISGFYMLLTTLVENTDVEDQISINMRESAFSRLLPTIIAYLKFDNLITSAKLSLSEKVSRPPFFDSENRTVLINLVLNLLSSFAKFGNLKINCEIWNTIDKWLCHSLQDNSSSSAQVNEPSRYAGVSLLHNTVTTAKSEISKIKASSIGMKQAFKISFINVLEIANFVRLLERLLKPTVSDSIELPYPTDLGKEHRLKSQVGVWPYMEFLITEVFEKSSDLPLSETKVAIQSAVLSIIDQALASVDWNLYEDLAPRIFPNAAPKDPFASGLTAAGVEVPIAYHTFVKLHHSLALLNYLFDIKACRAIFEVINLGDDALGDPQLVALVASALRCADQVLTTQDVFIHKLLPVLQNIEDSSATKNSFPMGYGTSMSVMLSSAGRMSENIYMPSTLGTKGLGDFYDVLLLNINSVVQIALYVGCPYQEVVTPALSILDKVSNASVFITNSHISNDTLLQNNRLLSIFESIDESRKIKFSFVQQIDSPNGALDTKFKILNFLCEKLAGAKTTTIAHFLLGFEVRASKIFFDTSDRNEGMLPGLVNMLKSIVDLTSRVNYLARFQQTVEYGPTKLMCLILKILIELCRSLLTSAVTLAYLRQFDLLEIFLGSQSRIDEMTIWDTQRFNGDFLDQATNSFVGDSVARETFLSYIESQNLIIQYYSFEVHSNKSATRHDHYMNLLLNGTEFFNGTPKILESLDVLNFQLQNIEDYKLKDFEKHYDLNALVQELCSGEELGKIRDDLLDRLGNYVAQQATFAPLFNTSFNDQNNALVAVSAKTEAHKVSETLVGVIFALEVKALQSRSLHSWTQLIQILTKEGLQDKGALILQVLQIVLPKVNNDYYERDILFAEELMSLCLFLCDIYEQEACAKTQSVHGLHRLLPLLSTCVNGLSVSHSTVELRSDIYLVLNKFLQAGIKSDAMLKQVAECLLGANKKLVDVICNDCVHSEGVLRITSIVCLESLVHLLNLEQSQTIVQTLIKNNSLSLLVRSLKRADEIISACADEDHLDRNRSILGNRASKSGNLKTDSKTLNTSHAPHPHSNLNENSVNLNGFDESGRKSGISIDTLLYELTALKTTLYLLIRIGQTKAGSSQLVQNEIFSIIRRLQFLAVDVDLGMEFQLESENGGTNATVRLSLDVPLMIRDKFSSAQYINEGRDRHTDQTTSANGNNSVDNRIGQYDAVTELSRFGKTVSYYELLVPVFQLVATILLSVGPSYRPGVKQAEQLLQQFRPLMQAIMKRETILLKMGSVAGPKAGSVAGPETKITEAMGFDEGLAEMVKLFTLIHSILSNSD